MENKRKPFGLPQKKNEYEDYKKRNVRIYTTTNGTALGKVDKITDEFLHLKPSMVNEGSYDNCGQLISRARIEKNIPTKVNIYSVQVIEPVSEGYLEGLANSINLDSAFKKIILS